MKKLNEWIKNLSLSQQLFVLIFFFITFFASFFFVFLVGQIDEFVEDQMYLIIDRNQEMITNLYRSNIDPYEIMTYENEDTSKIYSVFYTSDGNYSIASDKFNSLENLPQTISVNMKIQLDNNKSLEHYTFNSGKVTA